MKKILVRILRILIEPIALRLGFAKHENKEALLDNFYKVLIVSGFNPAHIVDIGANHGTWTRKALEYFPDAYYSLFEPQADMRSSVVDLLEKNNKINFHPLGVGKEEGKFMFTIADRDDSCTFNYSQEQAEEWGFGQEEIKVVSLNDFLSDISLPTPDLIKIDAEGWDLDVLEGASDFFGKTEIFLVEASISNPNMENTVSKVINYMEDRGYRVFDFTDLNRPYKIKALWLVEIVFVKCGGTIDKIEINK